MQKSNLHPVHFYKKQIYRIEFTHPNGLTNDVNKFFNKKDYIPLIKTVTFLCATFSFLLLPFKAFTIMSNTIIELKDVSIYQGQNLILSGINLTLVPGEFVYLIGKTGSGKSSFIKTIYADLPLMEGSGTVVDFDLKNLKENQIPFLRRKIGIVFQDFQFQNYRIRLLIFLCNEI